MPKKPNLTKATPVPIEEMLASLAPTSPTVAIANPPPEDPYLPGTAPQGAGEATSLSDPPRGVSAVAGPIDVPTEDFAPPAPTRPGIQSGVRYESRITILEAFQYPGNLKNAPAWVDRNWTGYASDYDALRGIEPGPALRVPTRRGDEVVLCRPGDYVVQQEVVLAHGVEPDVLVEVWARESFEKNFIPEDVRNARSVPKVTSSQPLTSSLEAS